MLKSVSERGTKTGSGSVTPTLLTLREPTIHGIIVTKVFVSVNDEENAGFLAYLTETDEALQTSFVYMLQAEGRTAERHKPIYVGKDRKLYVTIIDPKTDGTCLVRIEYFNLDDLTPMQRQNMLPIMLLGMLR